MSMITGFNLFLTFQFPALCNSYMCLLTYMAEIYPEKVCQLPEHLLKTVLASEEMGLAQYPLN